MGQRLCLPIHLYSTKHKGALILTVALRRERRIQNNIAMKYGSSVLLEVAPWVVVKNPYMPYLASEKSW